MAGYTRVDTGNNIADGNVISAADLDNEFDGIQAAFNASTGHNHDGTTGEGAPILVLGPTQDVTISSSTILPKISATVDIGSSSLKFRELHLSGLASIDGALSVTGVTTFTAQPVLSSLTANQAVFTNGTKGLVSNAITGTGNVVMSNSPTLVTPDLGTPSSAILTNATGLPVATGISGLAAGVAAFLATPSSSNLATVVTDETGTGALVFANSPTLVSPALGTPSSGTVTNLTGTASININGTVGATTPNTGAFTTLTTSGAVTHNAGTANGVAYLNGSKVLTTGSALTFDGTNLGVGTASPSSLLSGSNTNLTVEGTAGGDIAFKRSGGTARMAVGVTSSDTAYVWTNTNTPILFGVNSTEQMRLTPTGLGIGTSSPTENLDVSASVNGGGPTINVSNTYYAASSVDEFAEFQAEFYQNDVAARRAAGYMRFGKSGDFSNNANASTFLAFATRNAGTLGERMRLSADGNLGLGVTPSAWIASNYVAMQVGRSGSFSARASVNQVNLSDNTANISGTGWTYLTSAAASTYQQGSGAHLWFTAPSGTAGNAISFTQAMTLDASGNLGIGTSSPDYMLSIGASNNGFYSDANGFYVVQNTSNLDVLSLKSTGIVEYRSDDENDSTVTGHLFYTDGSERMRIDSSGNVGIGTAAPLTALNVNGTGGELIRISVTVDGVTQQEPALGFATGVTNTYPAAKISALEYDASDSRASLLFYTRGDNADSAPTERMRIDSSGNVGIGTTSPSQELHVYKDQNAGTTVLVTNPNVGSAASSGFQLSSDAGSAFFIANSSTSASADIAGGASGAGLYTSSLLTNGLSVGTTAGPLKFFAGSTSTERARIDSSGNVGIGTSSPAARLHVQNSQGGAIGRVLIDANVSSGYDARITATDVGLEFSAQSSARGFVFSTGVTPTERARIDSSGNLQVSNLAGTGNRAVYSTSTGILTNSSSDRSLKENDAPISQGLDAVLAMRPVSFEWVDKDKMGAQREIGFIAQEMQQIVPEVVGSNSDETLSIDYPKLVAVMTKAIQELTARVAALESN